MDESCWSRISPYYSAREVPDDEGIYRLIVDTEIRSAIKFEGLDKTMVPTMEIHARGNHNMGQRTWYTHVIGGNRQVDRGLGKSTLGVERAPV